MQSLNTCAPEGAVLRKNNIAIDRLISGEELRYYTGDSKSMMHLKLSSSSEYLEPDHPKKIKTGVRSVKFSEHALIQYIEVLKSRK